MVVIKEIAVGNLHYTECSREFLLDNGVPSTAIDEAEKSQRTADAQLARRLAYVAEADPLYLEWQYDQTLESEKAWRDKVAEIKLRLPLPE